MPWLHRTDKIYHIKGSPTTMKDRYGLTFTDANGKATGNDEWIFNPDTSAVDGEPVWKWVVEPDDSVRLMTTAEQSAFLAAKLTAQKDSSVEQDFGASAQSMMRAFAEVVLDEINILRQQFNATTAESNQLTTTALADRTLAQLKTAVRTKLG